MNQNPSQFRLCLSWSHAVASRISVLARWGARAMSAMSVIPSAVAVGRAAPMPPAPLSSAIDALQLPLGFRDGGLGVLRTGAVVREHVDHDEVGDRGRRLFAGVADT